MIQPYPIPWQEDLPPVQVEWQLKPTQALVLVHDLQAYFLRPFPTSMRTALVARIGALLDWARAQSMAIAYTAQPGAMSAQQRGLLADFWGPGMHASEPDKRIPRRCAPHAEDAQFVKWRYSAFYQTKLLAYLQAHQLRQLVLCGVYAHIGILTTAVEAYSHDLEVFIVADAVADFNSEWHRQALRHAADCCARVITWEDLR